MCDEIMNVNAETGEIIPENNLEIVDNNYFNGKDIVAELTRGYFRIRKRNKSEEGED